MKAIPRMKAFQWPRLLGCVLPYTSAGRPPGPVRPAENTAGPHTAPPACIAITNVPCVPLI